MDKLFARQLANATKPTGEVDLGRLRELVVSAYDESDRDRQRADQAISRMIQELDQLNRKLEGLVEERTAELRQREAQLRTQNLRFDAAVNHMAQALLMFDGEQRLLICNDRYLRLYGLSREIVKPGLTVRELLAHRKAAGTFSGDVDAYLKDLLDTLAKGATLARMFELPDGRTISVLNHPVADGGWVATHEDITEHRRARQQIAHMARHDALTDLPNRVLFRERLSEALTNVQRGEQLAVLCIDLDRFKAVNDTLRPPAATTCSSASRQPPAALRARDRHRRAPRRRRVRDHPGRHRRSRPTSPRWPQRVVRSDAPALRASTARGRGRHQHRHRDRARTTAPTPTSC